LFWPGRLLVLPFYPMPWHFFLRLWLLCRLHLRNLPTKVLQRSLEPWNGCFKPLRRTVCFQPGSQTPPLQKL
jgi:hypothetical protein